MIEREEAGQQIEGIMIGLDAYAGEAQLLYNVVWYITGKGVGVVFAAEDPSIAKEDGSSIMLS